MENTWRKIRTDFLILLFFYGNNDFERLPVAVVRQTRPRVAAEAHPATEQEGWVRLGRHAPCRERWGSGDRDGGLAEVGHQTVGFLGPS